jgi:hypothetical protein
VEFINGTAFSFYLSGYPYFPDRVQEKNMCDINRADSCEYMGNNYCCGTWYIDEWYRTDLSARITFRGNGDQFYANSYFNDYVGYQCELNPQYYDKNGGMGKSVYVAGSVYSGYDDNYYPYDSKYMVFSCPDYQYTEHYDFKECDPEDRMACRRYGREYCCATYHIASDVADYYASTYSDSDTSSIFSVTTGCEMSPSFYNFT